MHRYVIERDLPGVGALTAEQIRVVAQTSNHAVSTIGTGVQWIRSQITDDRIYDEYLAESEQLVYEHAIRAGLPSTRVSRVRCVVDPTSGNTIRVRE